MVKTSKKTAMKMAQSESLLLEQRLNRLYRQAFREISEESAKFWEKFQKQVFEKYDQYQNGDISQQDYYSWVNGHKKIGKNIDNLADSIAQRMVDTGAIASGYINETTPKIFAESANYEAYTIEKEIKYNNVKLPKSVKGAVNFSLINDDALKAVIEGNSTEFKAKWKNTFTDPPKIYKWTYSKVQDALHIGILKGESVPKIASRIRSITDSDRAVAIRNARTSVTSAYNQGQMATFERAAKMGLEVKKEWIATSDARTRDSHSHLDGVRVLWNEKFPNGLMCPGDPEGAPEEVYNCRCAMARVPFGEAEYNGIIQKRDNSKTNDGLGSYEEWKKLKSEEAKGLAARGKPYSIKTKEINISAKQLKNTKNEIYVSDNILYISKKEQRKIDEIISDSMKIVNKNNYKNIPKFIIANQKEMGFSGGFVAGENAIILNRNSFFAAKEKGYKMPADPRVTTVHELHHWMIAEEYKIKRRITKITDFDDYADYCWADGVKAIKEHRAIDPRNISKYAHDTFYEKDFAEVGTEIKTYLDLKKVKR